MVDAVGKEIERELNLGLRQIVGGGISDTALIVAVSGGLDSVVLLHALKQVKPEPKLVVAHIDHGLRSDSIVDATFVAELARKLGLEFVSRRLSPEPNLVNIEAWARVERYHALEDFRVNYNARLVCTAHHLNDQVETFLIRLFSGRFASSSDCIEQLSLERKLWRPLLKFTRADLERYAAQRKIEWIQDPTNNSKEFLRNRVRHELFPLLEEIFSPSVLRTVLVTLERLHDDEESLAKLLEVCGVDSTAAATLPLWRVLRHQAQSELGERAHLVGYRDYKRIERALSRSDGRARVIELGNEIECSIAPDGTLAFCDRKSNEED